ncbi:MAG: hypothetical protein ACRCUT_08390, partial [Spirochaetota bacterium]
MSIIVSQYYMRTQSLWEERAVDLTLLFSLGIAHPMETGDKNALASNVVRMLENSNIDYIRIYNDNGLDITPAVSRKNILPESSQIQI